MADEVNTTEQVNLTRKQVIDALNALPPGEERATFIRENFSRIQDALTTGANVTPIVSDGTIDGTSLYIVDRINPRTGKPDGIGGMGGLSERMWMKPNEFETYINSAPEHVRETVRDLLVSRADPAKKMAIQKALEGIDLSRVKSVEDIYAQLSEAGHPQLAEALQYVIDSGVYSAALKGDSIASERGIELLIGGKDDVVVTDGRTEVTTDFARITDNTIVRESWEEIHFDFGLEQARLEERFHSVNTEGLTDFAWVINKNNGPITEGDLLVIPRVTYVVATAEQASALQAMTSVTMGDGEVGGVRRISLVDALAETAMPWQNGGRGYRHLHEAQPALKLALEITGGDPEQLRALSARVQERVNQLAAERGITETPRFTLERIAEGNANGMTVEQMRKNLGASPEAFAALQEGAAVVATYPIITASEVEYSSYADGSFVKALHLAKERGLKAFTFSLLTNNGKTALYTVHDVDAALASPESIAAARAGFLNQYHIAMHGKTTQELQAEKAREIAAEKASLAAAEQRYTSTPEAQKLHTVEEIRAAIQQTGDLAERVKVTSIESFSQAQVSGRRFILVAPEDAARALEIIDETAKGVYKKGPTYIVATIEVEGRQVVAIGSTDPKFYLGANEFFQLREVGIAATCNILDSVDVAAAEFVKSREYLEARLAGNGSVPPAVGEAAAPAATAHSEPFTPADIMAVKPGMTPVVNQSIRTLQPINLKVPQEGEEDFFPHPSDAADGRGNPTKIGITEVVRDEAGAVTEIKYRGISGVKYLNPKDSADLYAVQTMPVKDGVMILPTENAEQAAELNRIIREITGGESEITLEQFDKVLKAVHQYYVDQGLVPDMYNSNLKKFERTENGFGGHRTIDDDARVYARDSGIQEMVIVEGHEGERLGFKGTSEHVGTQYGETRVVLVRDGDEWRKLDYEYAVKNLRNPDGSPIDWDAVPRVSATDVRVAQANRLAVEAVVRDTAAMGDWQITEANGSRTATIDLGDHEKVSAIRERLKTAGINPDHIVEEPLKAGGTRVTVNYQAATAREVVLDPKYTQAIPSQPAELVEPPMFEGATLRQPQSLITKGKATIAIEDAAKLGAEHFGLLLLIGATGYETLKTSAPQLYHAIHVALDQHAKGDDAAAARTFEAGLNQFKETTGKDAVGFVKSAIGLDRFEHKDYIAGSATSAGVVMMCFPITAVAGTALVAVPMVIDGARMEQIRHLVTDADVTHLLGKIPDTGLKHPTGDPALDRLVTLKHALSEQMNDPATPLSERRVSQQALDKAARDYFVNNLLNDFAHSGQSADTLTMMHYAESHIADSDQRALTFAERGAKANQPTPLAQQQPAPAPSNPLADKLTQEDATLRRYESALQALETSTRSHTPLDPKVLKELQAMPAQMKVLLTEIKNEYKDPNIAKDPKLAAKLDIIGKEYEGVHQHLNATEKDYSGVYQPGDQRDVAFVKALQTLPVADHHGEPKLTSAGSKPSLSSPRAV